MENTGLGPVLGQQPPASQPAGQPQPPIASSDQGNLMAGPEEATPEEQAVYEEFTARALLLVYDKGNVGKVVDRITGADDVKDTIADVAATIGVRVLMSAKEAGKEIPGDVVLNAGAEIVEALVELAENAGVPDIPEQDIESIFYLAADKFRLLQQDKTGETEGFAKADMAILAKAEQDGSLDNLIRGIGEEQGASESSENSEAPAPQLPPNAPQHDKTPIKPR